MVAKKENLGNLLTQFNLTKQQLLSILRNLNSPDKLDILLEKNHLTDVELKAILQSSKISSEKSIKLVIIAKKQSFAVFIVFHSVTNIPIMNHEIALLLTM